VSDLLPTPQATPRDLGVLTPKEKYPMLEMVVDNMKEKPRLHLSAWLVYPDFDLEGDLPFKDPHDEDQG